MIAYAYDHDGFFIGTVRCQNSPLEPGVFLLPAMATYDNPPQETETQEPRFDGNTWQMVESRKEQKRKEDEAKELKRIEDEAKEKEEQKRVRIISEARRTKIESAKIKSARKNRTKEETDELIDLLVLLVIGEE